MDIPRELPAAFDYDAALQTVDRETVEIIAGIFLETWERDIQRLREGVADGDAPLAERTAHSFKGSLACFAAEPAIQLSATLETLANQGRLAEMEEQIDALEREILALCPHLAAIAADISG